MSREFCVASSELEFGEEGEDSAAGGTIPESVCNRYVNCSLFEEMVSKKCFELHFNFSKL